MNPGLVSAACGAGAATLAVGAYYPNSTLFGSVVGRGPRHTRALYLTFDDGPNPTATASVLKTLSAARVPAAFFLVGDHVRRFPALACAIGDAGHEAGNHTEHHVKLHVRGPGRIRRELEAAHDVIARTLGRAPRVFRAPHGLRNPFVTRAAHRLGYRVVGWTFGVWDSDRPGAEAIRERVRTKLCPGAIILLHDGDGYDPGGDRSETAAALPGIIADAERAGYTFRPLAEALA